MMKFKSPVIERAMTRLSQAIAGGLLMSCSLLLLLEMTGIADSVQPLLRTPLAYLLPWPLLLLNYLITGNLADLATMVSNFVIYTLSADYLIRRRAKRRRLP